MIARALRWLMLLQVLGVLAIAWQLQQAGLAWPLAALLALSAVLAARALIVARNVWHSRHAEAGQVMAPLTARQAALLFGGELRGNLWTSSWGMLRPHLPAVQQTLQQTAPQADGCLLPVLLIHGYVCNRGFWAPLSRVLAAARVQHDALDLEPVAGSIDGFVPLVAGAVEALCARSGSDRVIIVAHSMGGLVARAYLQRHGAARIARVITLGTPHHGTALANLGVGENARQMSRPGGQCSAWLAQLAASETPALRAGITSIWSQHDNIVAPQASAQLPGARNLMFAGIGHVALAFDARVHQQVLEEITIVSKAGQPVFSGLPQQA